MPKLSTDDYNISVNGTDFSDHLAGVTLDVAVATYDSTAFGMEWDEHVSGRKSSTVALNWHQDFGAASVDAILWPILGSNATVVAKPTSGTVSPTNPSYTAVFTVTAYQPIAGSFGNLATFDTTWQANGTVTRGTA